MHSSFLDFRKQREIPKLLLCNKEKGWTPLVNIFKGADRYDNVSCVPTSFIHQKEAEGCSETEGNGIRAAWQDITRKVLSFRVGNNIRVNVTKHIATVCNCGKGSGKKRKGCRCFLHMMVVYFLRLLLEQKPYFTLILLNMLFIALGSRNEQWIRSWWINTYQCPSSDISHLFSLFLLSMQYQNPIPPFTRQYMTERTISGVAVNTEFPLQT